MKGSFQYILLGICGFFILTGVFVFASLGKFGGAGGANEQVAAATIWGTLDASLVTTVVNQLAREHEIELDITYQQFSETGFEDSVIQALARGKGPDALLVPHDLLLRFQDVLFPLPFESFTERAFRDSYIQGAELYISNKGIYALPIFVDPLVLYWNRTLFNNAAVARPPQYWDEIIPLVEKFSHIDTSRNILQSTIALGEFTNIDNAKEILNMLFFQAGTPVVIADASDGSFKSVLSETFGLIEEPAISALRFYTEFSNPVKSVYSWNRSLPSSQASFIAGRLALYIGFAHEVEELQEKNPNLNFDVAVVPQIRDSLNKKTFGRFYGLALLKDAPQLQDAFEVLTVLTSPEAASVWASATNLPPVRRDVLATPPEDPYGALFYDAAIRADAFLDPDREQTEAIYSRLIADITSGRKEIPLAVDAAHRELQALVEKF